MQKRGKNIIRLGKSGILLLFVTTFLILINSCTAYNPSFYPSYDVLNPGEAVRKNPQAWVDYDGEKFTVTWDEAIGKPEIGKTYVIVDEAFIQWVRELKSEIQHLRK